MSDTMDPRHNDHLYVFLIHAKELADWADALGNELDGINIHNTAVRIGKQHGLSEEYILEVMGYEDEE